MLLLLLLLRPVRPGVAVQGVGPRSVVVVVILVLGRIWPVEGASQRLWMGSPVMGKVIPVLVLPAHSVDMMLPAVVVGFIDLGSS